MLNTATPSSPTSVEDLRALEGSLIATRHHLHQHPELAFKEHSTARYAAQQLESWGYAVAAGVGGTGVVATLKNGDGTRSIGLRADMDALPIQETTGLAYASRHDGVMHACGHDGHTSMLLGAAQHLAATRCFSGTVHLIFQPAEEKGFDSGAKAMLADGLFERFPCDYVFAMHNHPGAPQGKFMWRTGVFMAAGDRVFVKIVGRGGHAARPHLAIDPVVTAAAVVMNLQSVVARNIEPGATAVVTVGRLQAGQALNVIPAHADIGISVRSFSAEIRAQLKERITAIIENTATAYGAEAQIDYIEGYPVVSNDAQACGMVDQVARALVGDSQVDPNHPLLAGSEDFAYMLQARPGALVRIGNGVGTPSLHMPDYDFNDSNLLVGAAFMSGLAELHLK